MQASRHRQGNHRCEKRRADVGFNGFIEVLDRSSHEKSP
jgi:hypothetical protein